MLLRESLKQNFTAKLREPGALPSAFLQQVWGLADPPGDVCSQHGLVSCPPTRKQNGLSIGLDFNVVWWLEHRIISYSKQVQFTRSAGLPFIHEMVSTPSILSPRNRAFGEFWGKEVDCLPLRKDRQRTPFTAVSLIPRCFPSPRTGNRRESLGGLAVC